MAGKNSGSIWQNIFDFDLGRVANRKILWKKDAGKITKNTGQNFFDEMKSIFILVREFGDNVWQHCKKKCESRIKERKVLSYTPILRTLVCI